MANTNVNKVVINGMTKIDLTGDTVNAEKLLSGYTAHDKSGAAITDTCTFNADTSDTTASADEVLSGETFYGPSGAKITGSMPNRGGENGSISEKNGQYTIHQGYHDGSGKVGISSVEKAKLVPENIREGITVLGVQGTMSGGESVQAETKTVTPSFTQQILTPNTAQGYNYLSQVTVQAIPVSYVDNTAGGQTLTVG